MKLDQVNKEAKKHYERPMLRIIELAADEILSVGCKTSTGGRAFGAIPCVAGSCAGQGS